MLNPQALAELALLALLAETILLSIWQGRRALALWPTLAAGALVLLAWRASTDFPWPVIATLLSAALICHGIDLWRRL